VLEGRVVMVTDAGEYSDIDLAFKGDRYAGKGRYTRKDGTAL
jgi:hypothetical protein